MRFIPLPRNLTAALAAFLALNLLLGSATPVFAQSKSYVVLIGINDYADPAITSRVKAEGDVKALYDLMTSPANKAYYQPDQIKLLLGGKDDKRPYQQATKENIISALKWAFGTAKEDDTVILAWLGQGAPAGKATCYFAADSTLKNREKDAVTSADVEEIFKSRKSNSVLLLLDVNFRGYAQDANIPAFSLKDAFKEFSGVSEDAEEDTQTENFILLSASRGHSGHSSPETDRGGLFMNLILDALGGKADKFGDEADGIITVQELAEYVAKNYLVEAPKLLGTKTLESARYPFFATRSAHFGLASNPAAAEQTARRLEAFAKLAAEKKLAEDLTKEGKRLLAKVPPLDGEQKLRKTYVDLVDGKLSLEQFQAEREKLQAAASLSRQDAELFADKVLKVANLAMDDYVKKVSLRALVVDAVKGLYRAAGEKLTKELQDRTAALTSDDAGPLRELLIEARLGLGNRKELKAPKDADATLSLMLHSLDQHSAYIDPETKRQFDIQTQQQFIGVGIQIVKDLETDFIRVTTPIRGSPAYKAGIKKGDLLIKVINTTDKDGRELPEPKETSTKGMSSTDVVKTILGKRGTKVTLVFLREMPDGQREIAFDLIRNQVQVETVFGVKRNADDSWDFWLDKENKIAYIRLSQFAMNTTSDMRRAIASLVSQGMQGLVLDLRFNPGGFLSAAVEISDLFVEDGTIVSIKPRDSSQERVYRARSRDTLLGFPIVVLVNGGSASASEIVSACLQDQGRAIVLGERSFGKGSVQNIRDLDVGDGPAELKLTIASFWRPSGKNLNRFPNSKEADDWGVRPTEGFEVKLDPLEREKLFEQLRENEAIPRRDAPVKADKNDKNFEDRQLKAALEHLRKEVAVAKKSN